MKKSRFPDLLDISGWHGEVDSGKAIVQVRMASADVHKNPFFVGVERHHAFGCFEQPISKFDHVGVEGLGSHCAVRSLNNWPVLRNLRSSYLWPYWSSYPVIRFGRDYGSWRCLGKVEAFNKSNKRRIATYFASGLKVSNNNSSLARSAALRSVETRTYQAKIYFHCLPKESAETQICLHCLYLCLPITGFW